MNTIKFWRGSLLASRERVFMFALLLVGVTTMTCIANYNWGIVQRYRYLRDTQLAWHWEGFGPERGAYNFTVVTAMLDIGRGSWAQQSRSYNAYLLQMQRMLRLDVNMVVFMDLKGKPFIEWMRRGRENRTRVELTSLEELPYYRHRGRMQEIMDSPQYQKDNELVSRCRAEAVYPEYDILQLSKLHFIEQVINNDPFKTDYYIWLDAGYGHGRDTLFPPDGVWVPRRLFEFRDQVTFLERTPGVQAFENKQHYLHKLSVNIMPGGFFGGSKHAFRHLYKLQQEELDHWMEVGKVDDDQTMNMLLYFKTPSLFRLVHGNWYDTFKYFNNHKS